MGLWSPTRVKILRPINCGNSYPMAAIRDTGTSLPHCRIPSSHPSNALTVKRPVMGMGSAMPSVALMMILTYQVRVLSRITRLQNGGLTLRRMALPIQARRCSANFSIVTNQGLAARDGITCREVALKAHLPSGASLRSKEARGALGQNYQSLHNHAKRQDYIDVLMERPLRTSMVNSTQSRD